MIVAAWSASGSSAALRNLSHLEANIGVDALMKLDGERFCLRSWGGVARSRIDLDNAVAWVGFPNDQSGPPCLENAALLGGQYALIVGHTTGLLLASSYPAGRCLYLRQLANGDVVASSSLAPLTMIGDRPTPDVRALGALLLCRSPVPSATVFKEVCRVQAGTAIFVGATGIVQRRGAPIEFGLRRGSPDELAEDLRAALGRVVGRSIEGARRVGVFVSGGLDSSSVLAHAVAVARGATRREIDAITWSFAGPGDDRPYLRELCDGLGIVPLCISSIESSRNIERGLSIDGAPYIWPTAAPVVTAYSRAREQGIDLILTGMGGDQIFNGDPRVYIRRMLVNRWTRGSSPFLRNPPPPSSLLRSAKRLLAPTALSAFPMLRWPHRQRVAARRWAWAGPQLRDIIRDIYVRERPDREWASPTNAAKLQRLIDSDFALMADNRRQMETLTGVTQVDPLLDEEVVNLVASFPQEALLFDGRQRGIFRHAMRQMLPESLRLRRDKARFEPAIAEMVRAGNVDFLRDLSSMHMLAELGLVDPIRYRSQFELVLSDAHTGDWLAIWPALAVEAFARSKRSADTGMRA